MANPAALELRRLQMLTEIGAENNTTTLIMIPSDFMLLAKRLSESIPDGNNNQKRSQESGVRSQENSTY